MSTKGAAELREDLEKSRGMLLAACAILGPFALAFFLSPRTVPQDLGFCGTMKAAAYELRYGAIEDAVAAEVALKSLAPLLARCPDVPEPQPEDRDRPVYRGQ